MLRTALLLALLALLSPGARGATALTVDNQRLTGDLVAIDATPSLTLSVEKKPHRLPGADLLALELRPGRPMPQPGQAVLELRNGDRLCGALAGGTKTTVEIRGPAFGTVSCPIAAIARVQVAPAGKKTAPDPAENADRLLFVNGDAVEGTIEAFGPKGVTFGSEHLGKLELDFDRIGSIQFARTAGTKPQPPKGVHVIARADDGTVLTGSLVRLHEDALVLKSALGADVSLRLASLLRLDFRGGRLAFLSDLEPASVSETPCFDVVWTHRRDLSVDGNPLRLGDRTFTKGLGTHSRCELTYTLGGKFRKFLAQVGIDEEVGDRGNAHVQVLVDGKPKFENKSLRGRDDPLPVDVDVTGAASLTLRVDFGEELDVCDHVDWAAARLVQ